MSEYKRVAILQGGFTEQNFTREQIIERYNELVGAYNELIDKIQDGKLKEFPCNIGDTVYLLSAANELIMEWEVTKISIKPKETIYCCGHKGTEDYCVFGDSEIGERFFTTKPAAEKRLEEIKAGKV